MENELRAGTSEESLKSTQGFCHGSTSSGPLMESHNYADVVPVQVILEKNPRIRTIVNKVHPRSYHA